MKPAINCVSEEREGRLLDECGAHGVSGWAGDLSQPDPDCAIRTWRWIVYEYQRLVAVGTPGIARRRDYLALCSTWAKSKNPGAVLESTRLEDLTREEAAAILERFRRVPAEFFGREFARLFPQIWAWDFSAVSSPKEFRKMVERAEVIFAVDWNTGAYNFAFGFDALETGASARSAETFGTITFAIEFESAQLAQFLAAIKAIKGWAEWNGEIQ
jgi:hypothetical protein